ncbi:MAG: hypothetical protein WBO44_00470 [Saprospiraceae bacterium]
MTTESIIHELDKLPLSDKLLVIEQTIKSIRTEKEKSLNNAVVNILDDYKNDEELTVYTLLDKEPFYETR